MKRIFILLALMVAGGLLVAEQAVLIDFSTLTATKEIKQSNGTTIKQHEVTMMDFSRATNKGSSMAVSTDGGNPMVTSLAIENWEVVLSSSSRSVTNQSLSYTKEATMNADSAYFAGKTVMGVRIHFPIESFNSYAIVKPPFEIPAFEPEITVDDKGNITEKKYDKDNPKPKYSRFEGKQVDVTDSSGTSKLLVAYGIVKNVGIIKAISVYALGSNFPHGLSVILKDADGNERTYFMGYLNFDGWKQLTWENPAYITEVKNREVRIVPLYPKSEPFVKFQGFMITRDAAQEGGDFIGYFKDVRIIYDKAITDTNRGIDDEDVWGIIEKREEARKTAEFNRFGSTQLLRYYEQQKQATETFESSNAYENNTTKK